VLGRHDLQAAADALGPWLAGGAAEFEAPVYDRWSRGRAGSDAVELAADEILVLEGVASFGLPLATRRRVLRLYVETDETGRARRVIADLIVRGASLAEARGVWQARRQDENPLIARARESADLAISLDEVLGPLLEAAP
jgi:uridine kinase